MVGSLSQHEEADSVSAGTEDSNPIQFTYDTYEELLVQLRSRGYEFTSYDGSVTDGEVLLRHDVDWSPQRATKIAEIEADAGVSATYFFLLSSPFYNALYEENRDAIDRITSLGHDVGLHFSTHQYWSSEPADEDLVAAVDRERDILSSVVDEPIDVVSFHIPPDWVLKRSYDGFVSTYEKRFFTSIAYRGDSNQRWRDSPPFADGFPGRLQILVHPGLWAESDQMFAERLYRERDDRHLAISEFLNYQFIEDGVSRS
ncbi:polysaccharide deacetylase family protein [Natrinema caseinilyticum]|uniref:polysaccharide deacetylase family protein n=1 Tax=Natrinema caseinilyticum TaxID=2961570 RepID=UPI0020C45090|nr:polysaccharide deacetylase family protein [Natrinema caseinilyticum]